MLDVDLSVVVGANQGVGICKYRLGRQGKLLDRIAVARLNFPNIDWLEERVERLARNAQGSACLDRSKATLINPVVHDLAGHFELRGHLIGREILGHHRHTQ
jgi:hypothetical protein